MMASASVRLHHPLLKSSSGSRITYAVELVSKPMPAEHTRSCNACSQPDNPVVHRYKTIHLRLDENGDTFVSDGILELLRTVPTMAGLQVVPGRNAPPQTIGALEQPQQQIILANGQGHYVPEVPTTDAVVRMRKPFQPLVEAIREQLDRKATAERMKKATTFVIRRK